MTVPDAQAIIDEAWSDIVQHKANCDLALAEKRWDDASIHARTMKWALSDLETGIDCMIAATTK